MYKRQAFGYDDNGIIRGGRGLNISYRFIIDTDMSVKQLLDTFIYTGTEAIANNPSDNNYARLLYVDKQGRCV